MSALPTESGLTSPNTQGQVQSWLLALRAYCAGLFGTTGTVADALAALGLTYAVKSVNGTGPDAAGNVALTIPSNFVPIDAGHLGVGTIREMYNEWPNPTIAAGATTAGTNLYFGARGANDGVWANIGHATGTWRNVTGVAVPNFGLGLFQRIA